MKDRLLHDNSEMDRENKEMKEEVEEKNRLIETAQEDLRYCEA